MSDERITRWADLESFVLNVLAQGPRTTRELKTMGADVGYTEDQMAKVVATRWMDLPRLPGKNRYEPWTVFHPQDLKAKQLGISHAVDDWLIAYMGATDRAVPSTKVRDDAIAAGFSEKVLVTAYRRCGIPAFKKGKHWYRSKP